MNFISKFQPVDGVGPRGQKSNIQIPSSHIQRNFKLQAPTPRAQFGVWNLVLLWSLELGIWSFFPRSFPHGRNKNIRASAFTLLELMVAIAIFAMIVATIYSTFILIVKSSMVAQEAAAQAQRERVAIKTVESSLMCIQSFQASMKYYSFVVDNGPEPVFSFTSRLPEVFPRNGKFGDFNVRRLTYTLEPGMDQEKNLVLRQNPILMDVDDDEKSMPLVLARNVKTFLVECWDTNAMEWDKEWDYTNVIPPLVRVTFTLASHTDYGNDGPEVTLSRVIALPCSSVPYSEQTPNGGGAPLGAPPGGPQGIPQMTQ